MVEGEGYQPISWSGSRSQADEIVAVAGRRALERELFRGKEILWQSLSLSPDGRFLSCITVDPAVKKARLMLVPVAGGVGRELLRETEKSAGARFTAWTPDSQSVVLSGGGSVSIISVVDGRLRQTEPLGFSDIRRLCVHPGGGKVAFFTSSSNAAEVWALENFLPDPKGAK